MGIRGNVDYLTLKEHANEIEEELLSSGVISQVDVEEAPEPEISIEIKEIERLRYNLSFDEISNASISNKESVASFIGVNSKNKDKDEIDDFLSEITF